MSKRRARRERGKRKAARRLFVGADYGAVEARVFAWMASDTRHPFIILDELTPDTPEQREKNRKAFFDFVERYGYGGKDKP